MPRPSLVIQIETALERGREVVAVTSPKSSDFIQFCHRTGATWDGASRRWLFDVRDRARVEEALHRCYGTTDSATAALCSLTVTLPTEGHTYDCELSLAGRQLVRVFSRDGGVQLGAGVRVEQGKLWSAGSRKNPRLGWAAGTVLLVRDLPIMAPRAVQGHADAVVAQIEEPIAATPSRGVGDPALLRDP